MSIRLPLPASKLDSVDSSNTCVKSGRHCKKAVYITLSIAPNVLGQGPLLLACQTLTQMGGLST